MRWIAGLFSLGLMLIVGVIGAGLFIVDKYGQDLPDYAYLKDYQPPILTRIYADDGRMMATIAAENRIFVPVATIPKRVINAFLAAEDQDFYKHNGVDFMGIVRAMGVNVQNVLRSRRPVGASTITQQVAKNMLLGNEISVRRKVREALLAMRLEKALTKDRILELYLNEIFLGHRSYGISAAALNYFNKSLDELSIAESAYLAALPKAPNNYHPVYDHDAAVARRNWVIGRMVETGAITAEEAESAQKDPLVMESRNEAEIVQADYFSEEVRRQLIAQYGEETVLGGGLAVKTSLDPVLQNDATVALRNGLVDYDRRQRGWRGPVAHLDSLDVNALAKVTPPAGAEGWTLAFVKELKKTQADLILSNGAVGSIPLDEMKWARKELPNDQFGSAITKPADVVSVGDVVLVDPVTKSEKGTAYPQGSYTLLQVPIVEGALVALDPHTGRVFAMSGGFSAKISQFNRATQAYRQPGSSFKPFVYMAALDKGFTPSSLVLDAPFEYIQGPGLPLWKPENYSQQFYGATPLRVGIEKSRNVMTVRLANAIGMPAVVEYAKKFGVVDDMPDLLSFALGAKETTVLRMATAYGEIVNGGKKIKPSLVDRIQNREGRTIWKQDSRQCENCVASSWLVGSLPPELPDARETIEDPRTAYQMVSILEGVVQRGTAAQLKSLNIPLAGKTGTTNESKDAWFVGFTPDLVCAVFVGFDDPKPLGSHQTGASVALPIFKEFMEKAVANKPAVPFRVPPGLRMVRVDPTTGSLALPSSKDAIWESFIPGTEPQEGVERKVLDGSVTGDMEGMGAAPAETTEEMTAQPTETSSGETAQPQPMQQQPVHQSAPTPSVDSVGTGGLY